MAAAAKRDVVRPEIVDAVWNTGHNTPFLDDLKFLKAYSPQLFKGCVMCTSGLNPSERMVVGGLVELHGGRYVVEMAKGECTHLITSRTVGEKYKYAELWQIKVRFTRRGRFLVCQLSFPTVTSMKICLNWARS